jgi:hypothetical protein
LDLLILSPAAQSGAFLWGIAYKFKSHSIFSPLTHRRARIIGTDMLCISIVLQVSSDDQEREQGSEDNPNVNAHKSSPATALPAKSLASRQYTRNISTGRRLMARTSWSSGPAAGEALGLFAARPLARFPQQFQTERAEACSADRCTKFLGCSPDTASI